MLWELRGTSEARTRRALRLIGIAFVLLAVYVTVASLGALISGHRPDGSPGGIAWTAVTAAVMFVLAALKTRTGRALHNEVLITEGPVTLIDGILATAVLLGVAANTALGWWWADPVAGLVIVFSALREALQVLRG
ncbi:cation transporter [Amnibacterium kyonggiense]|uniref:cation transporter n=1 Tax=Amnibacterium kyonggiense TaxID=595671 RepID=UPI001FEB8E91|nr:cation transporter [Amnibacterium kyonggiense]